MGVVHHSHYATWFEMARTELLRRQGIAYRDCEQRGLFIVVARLKVHYHRPARYDQIVRITATLRRASGARIEHDYTVHHDTELLCTGSTVLACTDTTGRIIPVPEFLRLDA
jgi:acyl-CoA thioester hydrolase